ncbi:MAG: hypothetical protein LBU22_00015, partial [Dysgonamonadaceae bacterium]|nr:hypothetical protein [Dysgonamonadaceae bacterium]
MATVPFTAGYFLILLIIPLFFACSQKSEVNGVSISEKGNKVSLENKFVKVDFDFHSGYYQVFDVKEKLLCIDSAYLQINDRKSIDKGNIKWSASPDTEGQSLLIEHEDGANLKLLLRFSLQKGSPSLILAAGVDNAANDTLIVKKIAPLAGGKLFPGRNITENLRVLDGNGGGDYTQMKDKASAWSRNNMMIYFGNEKEHRSVVLGGITYADFNKSVQFGDVLPPTSELTLPKSIDTVDYHPSLVLFAEDPVGKRLDPGTRYLPDGDRFYLDCITQDPFHSLETYGKVLSEMQNAHPNYYYFPSICLWYAMKPAFGNLSAIDDSPGAVEAMQRVKDSGWLKYTTMAIRLVPDCYDDDNENGWWDDEHWQMHNSGSVWYNDLRIEGGHYRAPYETTKKWCRAITDLGGIPLTYIQPGTRSRDYAEKYPGHMMFNESYHPVGKEMNDWCYKILNKGYTSYDYTDRDFCAHLREMYKNLHDGGLRGLMYDQTETGWALFGGLDDKYSTAGAAYRRIYQFSRDGLGPDAYIHERNIAIGSDISLGLVSSQRIWDDTDIVSPEMFSHGGLRWYKNRVVACYDLDAKNILKATPNNQDGVQKMLTMNYVVASRLLLATGFSALNQKQIFTLSRVFPFHSSPLTARPVDMLLRQFPSIYSFRISDDWQQVVFYNQDDKASVQLSAGLSDASVKGGLELQAGKSYYVYDFWNNRFIGKLSGK